MKTKVSFSILLLLHAFLNAFTQSYPHFECGNVNQPGPFFSSGLPPCEDPLNYIPFISDHSPTLTVQVTVHVLKRSDGTGNAIPDNQIGYDNIQQMIDQANYNQEHNAAPSHPLAVAFPQVTDTRIRLKLVQIMFHENTAMYNTSCISASAMNTVYNSLVVGNSQCHFQQNSMHLFFGNNPCGAGTAMACGIGCKKWAIFKGMDDYFINPNNWSTYVRAYYAGTINHEVGHNLGLNHAWLNDECSDTPNNVNCWACEGGAPNPNNVWIDPNCTTC